MEVVEHRVAAGIERPEDDRRGRSRGQGFLAPQLGALELHRRPTRIGDLELEPGVGRHLDGRRQDDPVAHLDLDHRHVVRASARDHAERE